MQFRGEKYLNTFIFTDANDCPNLLCHGATFRMGVLLPNYSKDMVVEGENMPHFSKMSGDKIRAPAGLSNSRYWATCRNNNRQYIANAKIQNWPLHSETTPSKSTAPMTVMSKQAKPVDVHTFPVQNTSQSGPPAPGTHVHKPPQQVLMPGDLIALQKVQHPHNGRTSVNRLPLTKQQILSHYSSCFEGVGQFPGEPYKFHLKPEHNPARHAPRKVSILLEDVFKKEIKSLVELGILEEVTEHTDWINS